MIRTSEEAVELDEQLEVYVFALWRFAVCAAHMMSVEVDTCRLQLGQRCWPLFHSRVQAS